MSRRDDDIWETWKKPVATQHTGEAIDHFVPSDAIGALAESKVGSDSESCLKISRTLVKTAGKMRFEQGEIFG